MVVNIDQFYISNHFFIKNFKKMQFACNKINFFII